MPATKMALSLSCACAQFQSLPLLSVYRKAKMLVNKVVEDSGGAATLPVRNFFPSPCAAFPSQ